jgi:hypothetical protein
MAAGLVGVVGGSSYLITKTADVAPNVSIDEATKALKTAQGGYPRRITVVVKVRLGFFAGTNVMSPEEQAMRAYPLHTKVITCKPLQGGVYEVVLERP